MPNPPLVNAEPASIEDDRRAPVGEAGPPVQREFIRLSKQTLEVEGPNALLALYGVLAWRLLMVLAGLAGAALLGAPALERLIPALSRLV